MQFGKIEVLGFFVSTPFFSESQYVSLSAQSVALVGPNGSGKSSLIKSLKSGLLGEKTSNQNPYYVTFDIAFPINLNEWRKDNVDPGIVQSIWSLLNYLKNGNYLPFEYRYLPFEDRHGSTGGFLTLLNVLWKDRMTNTYSDWGRDLVISGEQETGENIYFRQLQTSERIKQILLTRDYRGMTADELEKADDYIRLNDLKIEERDSFFQTFFQGLNFLVSAHGTESVPKWSVESYIRIPLERLEPNHPMFDLIQILIAPKTLEQARLHSESYGEVTTNHSHQEVMQLSVKFVNQEVWLICHLGFTEGDLGFELVDPDKLSWTELIERVRQVTAGSIGKAGSPSVAGRFFSGAAERGLNYDAICFGEIFNSDMTYSEGFLSFLHEKSAVASQYFKSFLPNAPELRFHAVHRSKWLSEGLVNIDVNDGFLLGSVELASLSEAQQRWAKISILLTVRETKNLILFIDEPERGIQRKIEPQLLTLFNEMEEELPRIFATHSAEIISHCGNVIQIYRKNDGNRSIKNLLGSIYPKLEDIGISQEEYFQSKKLIVFTEGAHDEAMLLGFARNIFEKEGIEVVACRGLDSWAGYFDSTLLGKRTKCKLVFLADSINSEKLKKIVKKAREDKIPESNLEVHFKEKITECLNDPWSDLQIKLVSALLFESHRDPSQSIDILSTGDWDCLEWVSPQALGLAAGETWELLEEEVQRNRKEIEGQSIGTKFKNLLKGRLVKQGIYRGLDPKRLESICADLQITGQTPPDIVSLIDNIVRISKGDMCT